MKNVHLKKGENALTNVELLTYVFLGDSYLIPLPLNKF